MFYKLFDNSEFKPFYTFAESTFGYKNTLKDLGKFSDEYRSYIDAFTNHLYTYDASKLLVGKVGYCLENDNVINSKGTTMETINSVLDYYNKKFVDKITKEDFKKVENEYFSFNIIDAAILGNISNGSKRGDYTINTLKKIFAYFGLDYEDLHIYKNANNTQGNKINQKWIGLIVFFADKGSPNKLLPKYPILENGALLFMIDYIIENYSISFIRRQSCSTLDKQLYYLDTLTDDMIEKLSSKQDEIYGKMYTLSNNPMQQLLYTSYYNQVNTYKNILCTILNIIKTETFHNPVDSLKSFVFKDMDTLTNIFINQLIAVKFLTKLYGDIYNATMFFENSYE